MSVTVLCSCATLQLWSILIDFLFSGTAYLFKMFFEACQSCTLLHWFVHNYVAKAVSKPVLIIGFV